MNAPVRSNAKAELLATTVEHIDITSFDARPIIDSMRKMSFSSRDTARAAAPRSPVSRPCRSARCTSPSTPPGRVALRNWEP